MVSRLLCLIVFGSMLLVLACCLAACSTTATSQAVHPDDNAPAVEEGPFNDWPGWDWRIDRPQMIVTYITKDIEPDEPLATYLRTMVYEADFDSIGLDTLRTLPLAEQQQRQIQAELSISRAMRFRDIVGAVHRDNMDNRAINTCWSCPAPNGAGEAVTRVIGHLNTAVGLDPSNPYAWYDLAYFTGVIGDWTRHVHASDAALAAIEAAAVQAPTTNFDQLTLRLVLDRSWHLRESGQYDACLGWLDRADNLILGISPQPGPERREALLIRGLVLAETGSFAEARKVAAAVREIPVYVRDHHLHIRADFRHLIKTAWDSRPNGFASQWIRSLNQLELGNPERALEILGEPDIYLELPAHLNYRYWNGAGEVFERCGMMDKARTCYSMAVVQHPYFIYFPMIGAQGAAQIHGQPGCGMTYFVAYRHFYIAGSRFAFAANSEIAFEVEEDPIQKERLATQALAALRSCRRRGIRPTSALALSGRIHFFRGKYDPAEQDLQQAYQEFSDQGREDPDVTLLTGLIKFDRQEFPASVSWLKRYVELKPEMSAGWLALGLARFYCGHGEEAIAALDRSLAEDPGYAYAWYNRGLFKYHAQDVDGALSDLKMAASLAPEDLNIARMLTIAGQDEYSRINIVPSQFDLGISREDSLAVARLRDGGRVNLAAEMQSIDPRQAESWLDPNGATGERLLSDLRASYAAGPTPQKRRYLAWCLLREDLPQQAQQLLLPLWGQVMNPTELRLLLEADHALGDAKRALALLNSLRSDELPVSDPEVWTLVAGICLGHGDNERALQALDVALDLDPENRRLWSFRDRIGR